MIEDVFKLAMTMTNPFDYDGLVKLCGQHSHTPPDIAHYYQKIGLIVGAIFKYPDLPMEEAYNALLQNINSNQPTSTSKPENKAGCGGCNKQNQISDGGVMR